MSSVTYAQFAIASLNYFNQVKSEQRMGQAVFNLLSQIRPDIASQIRSTPLDPFHKDTVPHDVWEFIESRW